MLTIAYDVETTGFVNYKIPLSDPKQARIIQLAALAFDETGRSRGEMNCLIKPDGWEISPGAQKCHGISIEDCENFGVPINVALNYFYFLVQKSDLVIAHNMDFDFSLIGVECAQKEKDNFLALKEKFCTMKESTPILKLPKKRGSGYKSPQLQEAYAYYYGENFEGAHDAMADVKACRDVYFKLKKDLDGEGF